MIFFCVFEYITCNKNYDKRQKIQQKKKIHLYIGGCFIIIIILKIKKIIMFSF